MFHLVARAHHRLFHDALEAGHLWRLLARRLGPIEALVLMPDHLHLIAPTDVRLRLAHQLSAYVQWRNARRGQAGPGVRRLPAAEPLTDAVKLRRTVRYVHLNPCRAGLCADPLAWPWSTHRDRVGLALWPIVPRATQPTTFHRYVSSDPTVHPEGTDLPDAPWRVATPPDVRGLVSALGRVPEGAITRRGPARALYLRLARTLCDASSAEIGALAGVRRDRVPGPGAPPALRRLAERVLDDPRFPPL